MHIEKEHRKKLRPSFLKENLKEALERLDFFFEKLSDEAYQHHTILRLDNFLETFKTVGPSGCGKKFKIQWKDINGQSLDDELILNQIQFLKDLIPGMRQRLFNIMAKGMIEAEEWQEFKRTLSDFRNHLRTTILALSE